MDTLHWLVERKNALEIRSPYGYTPSLAPGVAYLVTFALVTLVHFVLAIRYKYWVIFVTLIPGGILEIVGWGGRLWSHYKVLNSNPFIMQICTLILGPAFFSAWAYTVLGFCINRLGPAYSLLRPKLYLLIFITADIISLVLQAIGGGQAAVKAKLGQNTHKATKIMLAGILFQLGTMTIFSILALDFIIRVVLHRPYGHLARRTAVSDDLTPEQMTAPGGEKRSNRALTAEETENRTVYLRKAEYLLIGVAFASVMIFVRGVYRSIELAQGWTGFLITHEDYFTWLDGFPMILCFAAFAAAHPGWLLPRRQGWKTA